MLHGFDTVKESELKSTLKYNCKSKDKEPSKDCSKYKKQSLIFHPDKNSDCPEESAEKFKKLQNYCPNGQKTKNAKQVFQENPVMIELNEKSNNKKSEILQTIIDNCNVDPNKVLRDRQLDNALNIFKNMYMRYYYIKDNINDIEVDSNIPDGLSINRNFKVFLEKTIPRKMNRIKDEEQLCIYETILNVMGTLQNDLDFVLDNSLLGGKKKKKLSRKKTKKRGGTPRSNAARRIQSRYRERKIEKEDKKVNDFRKLLEKHLGNTNDLNDDIVRKIMKGRGKINKKKKSKKKLSKKK